MTFYSGGFVLRSFSGPADAVTALVWAPKAMKTGMDDFLDD